MDLTVFLANPTDPYEREAARIIETALSGRTTAAALAIHIAAAAPGVRSSAHEVRQSPSDNGLSVFLSGAREGVVYAAYAWLKRQGWSFHAAGDIVPPADTPLDAHAFAFTRAPRFRWRGLQLWNYWWPGRDSWSFKDYAAYLDQFPKMGLNQFDFPLYWYEPLFTGVTYNGAAMRSLPLSGVDVGLARIGAEALSGRGRFTSPDIPEEADDKDRGEAARKLLQRVLAYAQAKGVRTILGIELANVALIDPSLLARLPAGDLYEGGLLVQPSSPTARRLAKARLQALFTAFPDADVYSIWQSEMGVWRSTAGSPHPDDIAFRKANAQYADRLTPGDFDQLQWLRLAQEIADELKPGATLSTGGWGAERLMIAADELLPSSMIRATIADYEPGFGLRRNAFEAYEKSSGPRHHTTWSEVDQHLWIQQPKIAATSTVLSELECRGVDSVSMLHWRLQFNDADLSCFAYGCWDDGKDADEVRARWASAKFGAAAGPFVADAIEALERFNAAVVERTPDILRSAWWVGFDCHMSGLLSANRYIDGAPLSDRFYAENVTALLETADATVPHLEAAVCAYEVATVQPATLEQRERLGFWSNRARYSLALYRAHLEIARAVTLAGRPSGRSDLEQALHHLDQARAHDVIAGFAERLGETAMPEKGELGLLLSLNVKFLGSVKRLEGAIRRIVDPPSLVARGVVDVRAGAKLPRREYATFFELLHVASQPWTQDADQSSLDPGFDYDLARGSVGRLSPSEGVWTDAETVELLLHGPAGWRGNLDLYFYQELDWDTPFRVQDVYLDEAFIGRVRDFHGRGGYHNEGLWLRVPVAFPPSGAVAIRVHRRGGGDARLSAVVLT